MNLESDSNAIYSRPGHSRVQPHPSSQCKGNLQLSKITRRFHAISAYSYPPAGTTKKRYTSMPTALCHWCDGDHGSRRGSTSFQAQPMGQYYYTISKPTIVPRPFQISHATIDLQGDAKDMAAYLRMSAKSTMSSSVPTVLCRHR